MAKKIFVGNYKGGVGKTTSIYQIALHMVEQGKKVLLIDLDPQCSLSEICLARSEKVLDDLKEYECLNYVYDMWNQSKQYRHLQFAIDKTKLIKVTPEGIQYIPSNIFYKHGGLDELTLQLDHNLEDLAVLQQFFQNSRVEDDYEYILFDCPPSNNTITQGAFLLSDFYIIPSIIQAMSVRGIVHYIKTVETIYKKHCFRENEMLFRLLFGDKPRLIGIFETLKKASVNNAIDLDELMAHIKQNNIHSMLEEVEIGKFLFTTIINHYEAIARDTAKGVKRTEYEELTEEILDCLEQRIKIS